MNNTNFFKKQPNIGWHEARKCAPHHTHDTFDRTAHVYFVYTSATLSINEPVVIGISLAGGCGGGRYR